MWIAYYVLHKLHRFPHEFDELPIREKALITAFVEVKIEQEKEAERRARR